MEGYFKHYNLLFFRIILFLIGENESDEAEGTFKIKDFNCLDPDLEFIGLVAK